MGWRLSANISCPSVDDDRRPASKGLVLSQSLPRQSYAASAIAGPERIGWAIIPGATASSRSHPPRPRGHIPRVLTVTSASSQTVAGRVPSGSVPEDPPRRARGGFAQIRTFDDRAVRPDKPPRALSSAGSRPRVVGVDPLRQYRNEGSRCCGIKRAVSSSFPLHRNVAQ